MKKNLIYCILYLLLVISSIFCVKNYTISRTLEVQDPCELLQNAETQADMNILSSQCYEQKHEEYINFVNNIDYSNLKQENKNKILEIINTYEKRQEDIINNEFPHRDDPMYYGTSFSMRYSLLLIDFDEKEIAKIKSYME